MIKRLLALILCLTVIIGGSTALCEYSKVFILCNPETPVNVRKSPKRGGEIIGRLDFGDWTETDGKERNGYVHVINITEEGDGWIFAGYIVEDEPRRTDNAWASISASGRVMTYRWIAGKRNGWVHVCDTVKVYALSDEWAVTSKGYIRTKYLEVWYE